jgi:hypothetical protein
MTTTTPPARPAAPVRPIVPRPLWERHQLFQEPHYPEGLEPAENEEEPDGGW